MNSDASSHLDDPLGLGDMLPDADGDGSDDDDDASHLEIDDFQTREIRQIFLATLPDYLEPVRQMLDQLFAGGEGSEDIHRTLDTTLGSIATAAARVEIHDVSKAVQRARTRLQMFSGDEDSEIRDAILSDLQEIQALADAGSSHPVARRSERPVQTLVAAFRELGAFDRNVLERLTAAGLVTVDQIRMADPGEIVAVSGLDRAVVDRLIAALLGARSSATAAPATPNSDAVAEDPLEAELSRQLAAQVDAEVELSEVRGRILELQVSCAALREELAGGERHVNELREKLAQTRGEASERLATLSGERARQGQLQRRHDDAARSLERARAELDELSSEHTSIDAAQSELAKSVEGLVAKVHRLVQAAAGTQAEHGSSSLDSLASLALPRSSR